MTTGTQGKAGRILKRTLTGGALVAAVAGILFWTHRSGDGWPLFLCAAMVSIAAVWEASRMGSLGLRDLLPTLLVAAAGVLLLGFSAVEGADVLRDSAARGVLAPRVYRPNLALEYAFAGALAAAAFALARGLRRLVPSNPALPRTAVYLVLGAVVLFTTNDTRDVADRLPLAFCALAVVLFIALPAALRDREVRRGWLSAVGLAVWLVPPLPALWQIERTWGTGGIVAFLVMSKIGDTAGYYVGTAFGKRHPFPRISPGKTVEGCLGSLAAATLVGGLAVELGLLPRAALGIGGGCLAGAILNVAAQGGDLLESWVKRRAGVKDSSRLFGPSGGLLDQVDSLLLAVPVAVATWPWIFGRA